jgi:hypothetical protein
MAAVDRHMTPNVEMIIVGTTSPELLQVIPWGGKHVGPDIRLWREHDRGGHFPMLKQTDTLAADIVAFADLVGGTATVTMAPALKTARDHIWDS